MQNFYFEDDISGKTEWDVGVAAESIIKKRDIGLSPKNGYWTVWLRKSTKHAANDLSS